MSANAYSFLPWLRTGIATRITADPGTADRASLPVKLLLTADKVGGGTITKDVERTVQIYGPGDVVGVDPRAISLTEPRPWITNVEPNYLVHIEFYDEDFPWRYSPAAPDENTRRLRPWLALIVLAAGPDPKDSPGAEFTEGVLPDRPLPFIAVADPSHTLPPSGQLGGWAHVHVNGALDAAVASADVVAALPNLSKVLRTNADNGEKSLWFNPTKVDYIVGMDAESTQDFLRELMDKSTLPPFIYSHQWKLGDVLIWDTRQSMHKTDFQHDPSQHRLHYHAMTKGERPY